tara:strand:+ start:797 stop:1240 length:444 start_codon:yes stop_codon:yes gene_type:complete
MKKLIVITLFIFFITHLISQEVTVRNIDLSKTFVVRSNTSSAYYNTLIEENMKNALFENGLDVGDYYIENEVKDGNNREINLKGVVKVQGDYLVEIKKSNSATIQDVKSSKMVGSIQCKMTKQKQVSKAINIMVKKAKHGNNIIIKK